VSRLRHPVPGPNAPLPLLVPALEAGQRTKRAKRGGRLAAEGCGRSRASLAMRPSSFSCRRTQPVTRG
jgi:hypothetical protein